MERTRMPCLSGAIDGFCPFSIHRVGSFPEGSRVQADATATLTFLHFSPCCLLALSLIRTVPLELSCELPQPDPVVLIPRGPLVERALMDRPMPGSAPRNSAVKRPNWNAPNGRSIRWRFEND